MAFIWFCCRDFQMLENEGSLKNWGPLTLKSQTFCRLTELKDDSNGWACNEEVLKWPTLSFFCPHYAGHSHFNKLYWIKVNSIQLNDACIVVLYMYMYLFLESKVRERRTLQGAWNRRNIRLCLWKIFASSLTCLSFQTDGPAPQNVLSPPFCRLHQSPAEVSQQQSSDEGYPKWKIDIRKM